MSIIEDKNGSEYALKLEWIFNIKSPVLHDLWNFIHTKSFWLWMILQRRIFKCWWLKRVAICWSIYNILKDDPDLITSLYPLYFGTTCSYFLLNSTVRAYGSKYDGSIILLKDYKHFYELRVQAFLRVEKILYND